MIRNPGSAFVEQDQTERTSQAEVEVALNRILPVEDEIRHEGRNEDEVNVPFANYLVRNRDSTVSRVLDLCVGQPLGVLLRGDILRDALFARLTIRVCFVVPDYSSSQGTLT